MIKTYFLTAALCLALIPVISFSQIKLPKIFSSKIHQGGLQKMKPDRA